MACALYTLSDLIMVHITKSLVFYRMVTFIKDKVGYRYLNQPGCIFKINTSAGRQDVSNQMYHMSLKDISLDLTANTRLLSVHTQCIYLLIFIIYLILFILHTQGSILTYLHNKVFLYTMLPHPLPQHCTSSSTWYSTCISYLPRFFSFIILTLVISLHATNFSF